VVVSCFVLIITMLIVPAKSNSKQDPK
jgi:hypothetical protein